MNPPLLEHYYDTDFADEFDLPEFADDNYGVQPIYDDGIYESSPDAGEMGYDNLQDNSGVSSMNSSYTGSFSVTGTSLTATPISLNLGVGQYAIHGVLNYSLDATGGGNACLAGTCKASAASVFVKTLNSTFVDQGTAVALTPSYFASYLAEGSAGQLVTFEFDGEITVSTAGTLYIGAGQVVAAGSASIVQFGTLTATPIS